ncbi:M56 family metallopeptidase [Silvibacterium acidisoli]|uniref:M56 family metallopeptidase n=1 Tax=Acidobacteriaceae bacterium ZG23-2 TaxID=2883246 RepID=UPI00406CAE5F
MERWLTEYLVNAVWQIPLISAGAALLLRLSDPDAHIRHRVWLATLLGAVLVPMPHMHMEHHRVEAHGQAAAVIASKPGPTTPVQTTTGDTPAGTDWVTALGMAEASLPPRVDNPDRATDIGLLPRIERWYRLYRHAVSVVSEPRLSARAMRDISLLFLTIAALGLLRLVRGIWLANRLVQRAERFRPDSILACELERAANRMRVAIPEIRISPQTRTPAVVGVRQPTLLLPYDWKQYSEAELRAVLLHELAHLRRRDYGINLLCHLAELPVVWHPAVHLVQRQIHRTRELACDRMAAECEGVLTYTRSLVRLAEVVGGAPAWGVGAMGMGSPSVMRERVTELLEEKRKMTTKMRVYRVGAGVMVLAAAFGIALSVHVKPALAKEASSLPQAMPPQSQAADTIAPAAEPVVEQKPGATDSTQNPSPAPIPAAAPSPSAPAVSPAPAPAPVAQPAPAPAVDPEATLAIPADEPAPQLFTLESAGGPNAIAIETHEIGGRYEHRWKAANGHEIVIRSDEKAEPNPQEKQKIEAQIADAQQKMKAAQLQMNDALKHMQDGNWQQQMRDASRKMAEAQTEMQKAQFSGALTLQPLNIPTLETQKQIDDALAVAANVRIESLVNSKELQKHMEEIQKQMARDWGQDAKDFSMKWQFEMAPEAKRKALESAIANLKAEQDRLQKELDAVGKASPGEKK